jgi:predicted phage tail protein
MATGDNLKNTKAIAAAVLGFIAPGAAYLAGVSSDGVSSQEWIAALLICIGGGAVLGGVVQRVENKPKDTP